MTHNEIMRLLRALMRGQTSFTEEDAKRVYNWARQVRIEATLLDMVLRGTLAVCVDGGEVKLLEPPKEARGDGEGARSG
jgi:hypothetical protein